MNLIYIGKIVNTHGIKGELRIKSDFEYKDRVFNKGNILNINNNSYEINSYRIHKDFDMVTFVGYTNINDVLDLKGLKVYFDKDLLNLNKDEYLLEELIGKEIDLNGEILGKIVDYYTGINPLLKVCKSDNKTFYIPINDTFILSVEENVKVSDIVKGLL